MIGPATRSGACVVHRGKIGDARQASNAAVGTGPEKRSSTWWWARSRSASTVSSLVSRPSRMIATRPQVFSTSDRMWRGEEHRRHRPRSPRAASRRTSAGRADPARRWARRAPAGQGWCWRAAIAPTFCLLPLRRSLNRRLGVKVEPLDQRGLVLPVHAAAQVREVLERLRSGEPVVQRELAGHVADPPVDRHGVDGRLDPEHATPCRTSAGSGPASSGSSSSCPRRWARGSRRSRPAGPRGRRR